ncbi:MAG: hypothetical protein IK954_08245 [Clostridia bacterium]|nr:hypothetical protein [Clostridia bacterium]
MKRAIKWTAIGLSVAVLGCLLALPVYAGTSFETLDSSSFEEELDQTIWNVPEADVEAVDGAIEFTAESTEYSRVIAMNVIEQAHGQEELLYFESTATVSDIPEGGEFIFAVGMGSIESYRGDEGNVEIALRNDGGMKLTVNAYEAYGEPTELLAPKAVSGYGTVTVAVQVNNDCTYSVKFNGSTAASGRLPYLPEGSVGYLQSGGCAVSVTDVYVRSYAYDAPANSNFKETFDNDQYNANLLFSKQAWKTQYDPTYVSVESIDGNDMLVFSNAGSAHLSTMQQYSNFRLTFDVPWLIRMTEMDEDSTVIAPSSSWFGVSYGDALVEYAGNGYTDSPDVVYFDRDSQVRSFAMGKAVVGGDTEAYPFFAIDETRPISCMVELVDAHVRVGIKWMDEEEFTIIGEYDRPDGLTPTGYVHIWTPGTGNFAIDNIEMVNLDGEPQLVEVEFKTNKFKIPADYVWDEEAESKLVYRPGTEKKTGIGWNTWYLLIPCALVVAAVPVVIALIVRGKNKKKEGKADE